MPNRSIDHETDDDAAAGLRAEVDAARARVDELQAEYEELLADPDVIQEDRDAAALLLSTARSAFETAEEALRRVGAGTYGRCESCGEQIPAERLAAVPDAVRCVACSN
ncbi:TraR/DksA C4-type zinc finger protein [Dermatobacter hominis]|uniref:TraR/DksA C4-type zinc finger protein n=1 Tax=Dermatobacter hominis TaxID=2884263 RepID=UPI001D12FC37|nr:TraR/DksA C4-type zinc finger protein [Dermatobacter hominis]UDY36098.1 TraR/DksA C4-type zinc finger protein [Dermatobacter hominis]